jgi:hypothetical protein
LKGHAIDQLGLEDGPTHNLFNSDEIFIQQVEIQFLHGLDDHLCKESFVMRKKLAIQSSFRALYESLFALGAFDVNFLVKSVEKTLYQISRVLEDLDYKLRVDSLLQKELCGLQQLS